MKKKILLFTILTLSIATYAQKSDHVTAGVTGAFNFAKYNVKLNGSSVDPNYKFAVDGMAGFWLNFPLSKRLSLEPQLLFISDRMKPDGGVTVPGYFNGNLDYIGIPMLLKYHVNKYLAIPFGAQVDIFTKVSNKAGSAFNVNDFNPAVLGLTAGIEIMPKSRLSIFGRYVYGITRGTESGQYTTKLYDSYNQNIYAGLRLKLFDFIKKKTVVPPPPPPPAPADTDGDGVTDNIDKCPTVKGTAKYDGCPVPDTDNDGINDDADKCITIKGLAKYQGCPIPDTDKDGINDEEDKCPSISGVAKYQGCPIPDTDKDGINDEQDKCPSIPGVASQQGCPEISQEVISKIEYAAKNIYFSSGSSKLLPKSFKSLDEVVTILKENTSVSLKIDGHTDNQGSDDLNAKLSQDRTLAVKNYLSSKGVEENRLVSEGFGEAQPIADNKTAAGRQQNRRVELKLFY